MSRDQHWQATEDFYRQQIDEREETAPMLQLVEWLRNSKYSDEIVPFTSHYSLILGFTEEYPERVNKPFIAIAYDGNMNFSLRYYPSGKTHDLEKLSVPSPEIRDLVESLLIRMAHYDASARQP